MLLMRFVQPLFVLAVHASAVSVTFVVVDTLGNVVPEAEVTVRSNVRNTVEAGRVRSIDLPPGTYEAKSECPGFQNTTISFSVRRQEATCTGSNALGQYRNL